MVSVLPPAVVEAVPAGTGNRQDDHRGGHDDSVQTAPVWRMAEQTREELVLDLARQSFAFDATASDAERNCWLVVHRHAHGVLPSEYDIREVPEDLYLAVLEQRRRLGAPD